MPRKLTVASARIANYDAAKGLRRRARRVDNNHPALPELNLAGRGSRVAGDSTFNVRDLAEPIFVRRELLFSTH
jgi:hypothetical protein